MLLAAIGPTEITAESFGQLFFSTLGVPFEERESSHYLEGGYYKGTYKGATFTVFAVSVHESPNMPLSISVDGDDEPVNSAVDFIVRSNLIPQGYKFLQYNRSGHWSEFI